MSRPTAGAASRTALSVSLCLLVAGCSAGRSGSYGPRYAAAPGAPGSVVAVPGTPPPAMTFRFQIGDELAIAVWKETELSTEQRIQPDGTVAPILLSPVPVVGLTVEELRDRLTTAYKEYLQEPKVSVRVVAIHSDRVFVLGEVRNPQAVPLEGPTTLLQGVALAGGFAEEFASKPHVRLIRAGPAGEPLVMNVDAEGILQGRQADVPLRRGDVVFVPAKGVTEWARVVGQALAPLSTALGAAGTVASIRTAQNTANNTGN